MTFWVTNVIKIINHTGSYLANKAKIGNKSEFEYSLKIQTQKGSNERLFILTQTHSITFFGEIPFIKPQNDS